MSATDLILAADFDGTCTNSLGDSKTGRIGRRFAVFLQAYQRCVAFCSAHHICFDVPIPTIAVFCQSYREGGLDGLIKPHIQSKMSPVDCMAVLGIFKMFFEERLKGYHKDDLDYDFLPEGNLGALATFCEIASVSLISYRNQPKGEFVAQCRALKVIGPGMLRPEDVNVVGLAGASSAESKLIFMRKWYKRLLREQKAKGWKPIAIGDSVKDYMAAIGIGFPVFIGVTETGEDGRKAFNELIGHVRESDGVQTEAHLFPSIGHPDCIALVRSFAEAAK